MADILGLLEHGSDFCIRRASFLWKFFEHVDELGGKSGGGFDGAVAALTGDWIKLDVWLATAAIESVGGQLQCGPCGLHHQS